MKLLMQFCVLACSNMMMVEDKWQDYVFPDRPILAITPTQNNCPNRYGNWNRVKLKASDSHRQRTAT
jgi:hypothetical protein